MIETANLQLIPCELAHFEAILRDKKELEPMLNVTVPDNWPEFPESIRNVCALLQSDAGAPEWSFHLFVHAHDRVLIGEGGYKGRPDAEGLVEIGYALIPEYRGRGLATEAARGMIAHAFSYPEVRIIQAHTLPDGAASINVLKKLGMKPAGSVHDREDGYVLRWRLERQEAGGKQNPGARIQNPE
jgi:[ribosomal protein S5]-alanine N-acetyltransferase